MAGDGMWRPPLPGLSRVGRYWLECEIGRGGMGAVHLASSRGPDGFKKLVAIKTLLPALDGGERFVKMLLDEARVASGLMHPNIVQLYDLGQDGALPFLVMEYVHGESLASIEGCLGRLPDRIAVEIACQVLDALAYASDLPSAGGRPLALVHRDLSPQNVLVSYDGVPKLVDFGIARATVRETRTDTGVIKGRFHYMPPEQRMGRPVDPRADLYALGVVLYEATVGRHPFEGSDGTPAEVPAPTPWRADYPEALLAVIRRATRLDREDRFPDAASMLLALREVAVGLGAPVSRQELATLLREPFGERRRVKNDIIAKGEIGARPTEELGLADTEFRSTGPDGSAARAAAPIVPAAGATPPASPLPGFGRGRRPVLAAGAALLLLAAAAGAGGLLLTRGSVRPGPRTLRTPALLPRDAPALRVCVRADEHLRLDQQQSTWPLVRLVASGLERAPGVAPVHAYRVLDELGWNDAGGAAEQQACQDAATTVDVWLAASADGGAQLEVDGQRRPLPPGLAAGARAALEIVSGRLGITGVPAVPVLDDSSLRRLLETREFFYFTWGEQQRTHFEAAIREAPGLEEPYVLEALNRWWTGGLDNPGTRTLRRPPDASVRTTALLDAVLALEEDRPVDAARLAQLALEDRRYGEDPIALYLLGEALYHGGRPAEGTRIFERALAAEPQLLVVTHHLFEHQLAEGNFAAAEALAARWQRIAPGDFHAEEYRALAALGAGRYHEAETRFEAVLERVASKDPGRQPFTHVGLIYARALAGDLAGALRRAEEVSAAFDDPSVVMPETAAYALGLWQHDEAGAARWAERIHRRLAVDPWPNLNMHVLGYSIALTDLLAGHIDARARWLGGSAPERMARRYRFAALREAIDVLEAFLRKDRGALAELAGRSSEALLSHLAWGLRSELDARYQAAAEEFEAALSSSGNGELDCIAAGALARVRRAAGDVAGAAAACERVVKPFVPRPYCVVQWEACGKLAPK